MVELLVDGWSDGLQRAFALHTILYCILGVTLGMLVGVLPGIGVLSSVVLLMPLTFHLDSMTGIAMLSGIYFGAAYGGSTASILLNLPGTANTAITCLDGYPMAQQGRAGIALFLTTIASFVGSIVGILLLAGFAFPLAALALRFGSPEYFALMVLGLVAAAMMTSASPSKSLAMIVFGLMVGTVGIDGTSGVARYTFGVMRFSDGLSLVAVALGLFGLAELMRNAGVMTASVLPARHISFRSMLPTREDWRRSWPAMLRGSAVGAFFGALPGAGAMIASFAGYAVERRIHKRPEEFGKGAVEGISGPESANNSAIMAAFIPTLTLGIPGDAIMALMLGVLMIHGVAPGPQILTNDPGMFWGLIICFLFGNIVLLFLNIPLINVWVRLVTVPYSLLFPSIIGFLCIGVYSVNYSVVDLYVLVAFGISGYMMYYWGFPVAPMILGLVLGPMLEENFRRSMILNRGDPLGIIQRPISGALIVLSIFLLCYMIYSMFNKGTKRL